VQTSAGKLMACIFWDSGIQEQRYHLQFQVICADIKKVKTVYSKDSAKQEDKSSPPPGGQCQNTHQSVHKGPITTLKWNVLPYLPYSPD
jgi:hypothetical protein